ncbi:zyxin [Spea bombifrons]|uniref:zyxin n=1 Tax=Spea bombifrons TaxID=233779 RepID=UPI00234A9873|nr:zyxin [Spea bombifrons]
MDPAAPATRMTSSFTINISTPSFYNSPKKFAPVVPPKPKVNPFKASEEPEVQNVSVAPQERSSGSGVRAFLGKVGAIPSSAPSSGDQEDFILPPPPPNDDAVTSPTTFFPPPPPSFGDDNLGSPTSAFPPPPPLDFSEPFPPAIEESFPSPPPLEESPVEAIEGADIQVNSIIVPPPPPAPSTFSPKPVAPTFAPKPAAPTFVPKPAAPAFIPEPPAPTFSPKPVAPTFSPKPVAPTFSPKPAAPTFSPKPAAPTFVPKPTTTAFTPEPAAPAFVTDPAVSSSVHNPAPPLAVAPKPAAPFAVSPKPTKYVPKQPDPHTLSTPPSAPAPPPSHTFSPKPLNPPSFSPKPSAPTFAPRPQDTNRENSQPPQKFSSAQPSSKPDLNVTCGAPRPLVPSGTRAPGFSFAQQREKPQVLEKPRPDAEGPQSQNVRSLGSHNESIRSQANGAHGFRPQPEGVLDARPKPDEIQKKEPPPKMQRSPEADGSAGPPGLNMNEVMELEMLAQQLMREMDNQQAAKSQSVDRGQTEPITDRCGFCGKGLSRTETIVKAGEHHYHVACFTCSKCEQQLQGRQYYESAGKPLCEECYEDTLERCAVCDKKITERLLKAMEKCYHPGCFTCAVCRCSLQGVPFIVDDNNQPHCVPDYHRKYAPKCSVCGEPIAPEPGRDETVRVFALERNFHMMCYRCEDCSCPLSVEANDSGCFPFNNHVLCKKCFTVRARAAL